MKATSKNMVLPPPPSKKTISMELKQIDYKKLKSDAKDLAAKDHGYDDWDGIDCLQIDWYEKESIRASMIDYIIDIYDMLLMQEIQKP